MRTVPAACGAIKSGIAARVPIWITESGLPTGLRSERQQAAALRQLVQAARDYSGTFNITDYRWNNLRDSVAGGPVRLISASFSLDGLLRSN